MAWVVKQQQAQQKGGWVVKQPGVKREEPKPAPSKGAWNWVTKQLVKPVASASNFLEDAGKGIAAAGIAAATPASFREVAKKVGFNPIQNQKDVWAGRNQRTYSTIMNEIAKKESNPLLRGMMRTTGYGGDFILDPLNKVKVAALTKTGTDALKTGNLALSAAEQAQMGQRALLQVGKYNVLPQIGNKVLEGSTKLNDAIRGTEYGGKLVSGLSKVSSAIRPAGVSREEFKILADAKSAARNTTQYTADKAIQFAKDLEATLRDRKASQATRSYLLHAVEKGDRALAPKGLEDVFDAASFFKKNNEEAWRKLGGSTVEGYGLAHVATKEVAENARKKSLTGGKLFSTQTPQDIHREWVKVDGKVANLADEGIKFDSKTGTYWKNVGKETANGGFAAKWEPVKVEQATAQEVNNALSVQGKSPIFQEDLATAVARMGVSTGRKQAGVEFLEATKGLKGEEAKKLVNETYEKITNVESIAKALKGFDYVQNIWKAQALLSPSYHIRNAAGNLWNNYLAGVSPTKYGAAAKLQKGIQSGNLTQKEIKIVDDMKKLGVLNTGQYGGDIAQSISDELGKGTLNPLSQRFAGYRANRAIGSAVEDNAKIAHYLQRLSEGFTPKAAADSVKKYLFDYGDLTWGEQNILKRFMPFYTWTRKNIPLQVQAFFNNPGKYSKIGTAKKDIEEGVQQPNEQYMSDYMKSNAPVRMRTTPDGRTEYFLLGAWLPAAAAFNFLSNPAQNAIGQATPLAKLPLETLFNRSSYFQNTLGEYDQIKKYPGHKVSYLGMDVDPRVKNAASSVRFLNELDKWNPGEIFGSKNKPSILQGYVDNASNQRGGRYTQEIPQWERFRNLFTGKLASSYDPKDAKYFYDKDTQQKLNEYMAEISRASKNKQDKLADKLREEMKQFKASRRPFYLP